MYIFLRQVLGLVFFYAYFEKRWCTLKGLTIKQKKFADEYIISGNATQSAIKAGYSEKTAGQTGADTKT